MLAFLRGRRDEKRALAAYKQARLFADAVLLVADSDERRQSSKFTVGLTLLLTGAFDAGSQLQRVPDHLYVAILPQFLGSTVGVSRDFAVAAVLALQSQFTDSTVQQGLTPAHEVLLTGGQMFNAWIRGNTMISITADEPLLKYCDAPQAPAGFGALHELVARHTARDGA